MNLKIHYKLNHIYCFPSLCLAPSKCWKIAKKCKRQLQLFAMLSKRKDRNNRRCKRAWNEVYFRNQIQTLHFTDDRTGALEKRGHASGCPALLQTCGGASPAVNLTRRPGAGSHTQHSAQGERGGTPGPAPCGQSCSTCPAAWRSEGSLQMRWRALSKHPQAGPSDVKRT